MKTYTHLTYTDMVKIETFLEEGYSLGEIALRIGKHKTTLYRCIEKNRSIDGIFSADTAWKKISERKSSANTHRRILSESILEKYILTQIQESWSPEQIAGRWTSDMGEALCHETIYQYIYKYQPQIIKLHLRRKGKKYQHQRKEKYQIRERRMIDERPLSIETLKEVGHWEGDTIVGKNHQQGIVTNVERKSGFLLASKIERRTAEKVYDVTIEDFIHLPDELKISITYDNGKEFAWHKMIETHVDMTVYFAHAYSPWERGSNENTNGLLREFISKGTDFNTVPEEQLDYYVSLINNRPRKRLGFKTPYEVFQEELEKVAVDGGM